MMVLMWKSVFIETTSDLLLRKGEESLSGKLSTAAIKVRRVLFRTNPSQLAMKYFGGHFSRLSFVGR